MKKIVFLDSVHPILEQKLSNNGFFCIDATSLSKENCISIISDAFGIVLRSRFRIEEAFLNDATNIKFIARSGSGMENIDVPYCEKRNISLFNSPEGNRNAVAEHTLGLLLNLLNKINNSDTEVRSGKWDREGNRGEELDGKTIGIIGFGNNGKAFAKKLKGFDVKVLAYDKYKSGFSTDQVIESSLDEIYKNVDVISFHIPFNNETKYWANESFFSELKKPTYLINIARGKIVKTEALLNAIENKKIKGAALDVLEFEPSSFEPFLDVMPKEIHTRLITSDKLIFTPHVAGWTKESYYKLSDVLAEKIITHFNK